MVYLPLVGYETVSDGTQENFYKIYFNSLGITIFYYVTRF